MRNTCPKRTGRVRRWGKSQRSPLMTATPPLLDYYATPVWMTDPGAHAPLLRALPAEPEKLAGAIQGLLLHEHWAPAYSQTLGADRRAESHIRSVGEMLERLGGVTA